MPEQVIKDIPDFYDREVDLTTKTQQPSGIPFAVIGTAQKGPAFVPVSLAATEDRLQKFGSTDPKYPAQYGLEETLKNRNSALFMRILGAGANETVADIQSTQTAGIVRNAGFKLSGSLVTAGTDNRGKGFVQFLVAKHVVSASEALGMPMFTDNDSYTLSSSYVHLVRAAIFTANDTRIMLMGSEAFANGLDDLTTVNNTTTSPLYRKFGLVISSSAGASFATTDGVAGIKFLTASLDPSSRDYIGKTLNTDPERFETEKHLLYLDFPVDNEIAAVASGSGNDDSVAIYSGSSNTSSNSGLTSLSFLEAFGRFDTRYKAPASPWFISQPFGNKEYDLFKFEALDDGEFANIKTKISISNLRASTDPNNQYGTFSVIIRDYEDSDFDMKVLERFSNLSLDPEADNYIAKIIGDKKVYFNFDVENEDDRRLINSGKYGNKSKYVRIIMNTAVEEKRIPALTLPFGFRGIKTLLTNQDLVDSAPSLARLSCSGSATAKLPGSLVPPLPLRFKVTRGEVKSSPGFTGEVGTQEVVDSRLYWGIKFERNTTPLNSNVSNEKNKIIDSFAKFQGIEKLDVIVTGSVADSFNNNKFTLAKVVLQPDVTTANLTATADIYMKNAAYIRNASNNTSTYNVTDGASSRVSFATLINTNNLATTFNKFTDYLKFTTILQGGFDGVNILDKNSKRLIDRATSTESSSIGYGAAHASYTPTGFGSNQNGSSLDNSAIFSYRTAIDIMTEPNISNMNVLAIPGIREPLITDYALEKTRDKHQMSFAVIDIPQYDSTGVRVFDGETTRFVDPDQTANTFDGRALDFNNGAAYFPSVVRKDDILNKNVYVPATVAALSTMAFGDKVSYPWFAPAGFNRASLDWIKGMNPRSVKSKEREILDLARINSVILFPGEKKYAIFSQKTLQQAKTALDRINVKRLVLEIKRQIVQVANSLMWEQVDSATREQFVRNSTGILSLILSNRGINNFKIICDNTNNSSTDENNRKINGRIEFTPTRAAEKIIIDFIVFPSGVQF